MPPEYALLVEGIRAWAPSIVSILAGIGINRRFKKHDALVDKVNGHDTRLAEHETRMAVVETRCEERGSC